jgi:hypothetical protein
MKDLTDEECDALDEYYTKNPPDVDPRKNRIPDDDSPRTVIVDRFSARWLMVKAIETQKSTIEIIHELIQKEIAATH